MKTTPARRNEMRWEKEEGKRQGRAHVDEGGE